jgi:3-hydroxyacyl-[acyl-carrier-protein] dehydratase
VSAPSILSILHTVANEPVNVTEPAPDWLFLLPHEPPMRLVERVIDVTPGVSARCTRLTRPGDWFFQGHFPGQPVVPAIILVELLAQTGGLAIGSAAEPGHKLALRVAAFGGFKFPRAAGADMTLEAVARVAGRMGGLYKIEGEVTADGQVVASGALTLAEAR